MLCTRCGESNALGAKFCVRCASPLPAEVQAPEAAPPAPSGAPAGLVPGLATPRTLQSLSGSPVAGPVENSGKAVASLICGVFAWFFPAAVAAVILGHVSLSDINRSAGRLAGRGMAIAGLALGYVGLFFIPVLLIIVAIVIPNLLHARMAANEAAAVGALRTIDVAAVAYSASYSNGFPPSLRSMDGSATTPANCNHAHLISTELASRPRNGYIFRYIPTGRSILGDDARSRGCTVAGSSSYQVHADPVNRGTTGRRSFYTDQTGVIRAEGNAPATSESAPIE